MLASVFNKPKPVSNMFFKFHFFVFQRLILKLEPSRLDVLTSVFDEAKAALNTICTTSNFRHPGVLKQLICVFVDFVLFVFVSLFLFRFFVVGDALC